MGLFNGLTATLTAMSANDGCGGWVVREVGDPAECDVEGVDGLALEAESDVGVDAGGDADVGVAEEFLDDDEVDALFQEQGGFEWRRSWKRIVRRSALWRRRRKRRVRLVGSSGLPFGCESGWTS